MNKQFLIACRKIARVYGVKIVVVNKGDFAGYYSRKERVIGLNIKHVNGKDIAYDFSVFFHELGHVVCHELGMWKNFYAPVRNKQLYKQIALKAEKDTDRMGEKLMKMYTPTLKYGEWYLSIDENKWKRAWWNKHLLKFNCGKRKNLTKRILYN